MVICFYFGWSSSTLLITKHMIKVGSKSWLLTYSSNKLWVYLYSGIYMLDKSETLPKPKLKIEKLCQSWMLAFILHLVSITDTYCIRMYDFIHIIRFFKIPPFELDFQNDPGKCDFFHFSFGKLMLYSYLKFLVVFLPILACFLK